MCLINIVFTNFSIFLRMKATNLIMGRFDNVVTAANEETLATYLTKLAEASVHNCRYIVIIAVKSPKLAKMNYKVRSYFTLEITRRRNTNGLRGKSANSLMDMID